MPRFDILGIGENTIDMVMELAHFPALGSKEKLHALRAMPGGQVATAMIACQRWGLRTHYVGCVGDDGAAALHRRELRRVGVRSHLVAIPGRASRLSFILLDKASGERTILWKRDRRLTLSPRNLRKGWVYTARLLYVDGHDPATTALAARWARQKEIPVMGDFDHLSDGLRHLMPFVDYAVTSRDFPRQATGEKDLFRALQLLSSKYGFRLICATLGVDGALAWDGRRFWYAPSYQVRVVDTTGAGDLFHAGVAYGILHRWDLKRILNFSSAAAALNCKAIGAQGRICSLRTVEAMQHRGRRNRSLFSRSHLERASVRARRMSGESESVF